MSTEQQFSDFRNKINIPDWLTELEDRVGQGKRQMRRIEILSPLKNMTVSGILTQQSLCGQSDVAS